MMSSLSEFRLELERQLNIIEWFPKEHDLIAIANEIARSQVIRLSDLRKIVSRICPISRQMITDGLDNSDLRTLLALAAAAATQG
jgi:hypothetical protein